MPNNNQTGTSVAPLTVYGPDNRPIALSEGQRTEQLLGNYDSYLAASFALPPFNPDHLISSKGWRILEEQLNLAAARSPLNVVRTSVLAKGLTVQQAVSDETDARYQAAGELAGALRYALDNIEDGAGNVQDPQDIVWDLLAAVHYGFAVTEINWRYLERGAYAGKLGFLNFAAKPCKQIGFSLDIRTMAVNGITSYTPLTGYDFNLPPEKVLRYTFQPEGGLPYGRGIGRVVYKHTWSIEFLMKFWNIALEVFGTPFILAKANPGVMALARQVLAQIRQGAPGVLPIGVDAELLQTAAGGLDSFNLALQWHGDQCTLGYLNSILTSGTTGGTNTNALGQVHQDTTQYGLSDVRGRLERILYSQLVRRWVVYNYGEEFLEIAPKISLGEWDAEDMKGLSSAFSGLIKSKVVYEGEPWLRDRLKAPPPSKEHQQILDDRRARADASQQGDDKKQGGPGDGDDPEDDDTGGTGDA